MSVLNINSGLYTDHYELTMAQGYFLTGKKDTKANFDYFFRKNPYEGGFVVYAGLDNLLEAIHNYRFREKIAVTWNQQASIINSLNISKVSDSQVMSFP